MLRKKVEEVAVIGCLLLLLGMAAHAISFELPIGTSGKTEDKPQSKLWYNDSSWWGILPSGSGLYFYRMQDGVFVKQTFSNALVDAKNSARADVLWNGSKLFVLIYKGTASSFATYTYDTVSDTYTRVGTATPLAYGSGVETGTVALDSVNTLWTAYESVGNIYVKWSQDYKTWSAPFQINSGALVSADDIAAVVAFDNKIGVLWSDHTAVSFNFRTHTDGASGTEWNAQEIVAQGNKIADDHIHLTVTPNQDVLAATKSGSGDTINLFVRRLNSGWSVPYKISQSATRPIVLYERDHDDVYVFYTYPTATTSAFIVYKKVPFTNLAQITTTPAIKVLQGTSINNVTSTKDNIDSMTDIVVAAKGGTDTAYYTTINVP